VRGLFPLTDESEVSRAIAETAQALRRRERFGRLPLAGVEDPGPALTSLRESGGLAGAGEVRPLVALARSAEAVRESLAAPEEFPRLSRIVEDLPPLSELLQTASRLFEPDGSLSDRASPRLLELRTRLRRDRQRIYDRAREWLERNPADAAGDTVVLRDARYCVPVAASAGPRAPGIVHGRSGSGATIFVEPPEILELNNELSLLVSDLRREEERLRREFGRELLGREDDLRGAAGVLAEIDAIEARAGLARDTEAVEPELSDDGRWELSAARHPLLDERLAAVRERVFGPARRGETGAVPLDIALAARQRCLLVSGPNAGGKTVVLKTLGLFSRMAQAGFLIPARRAVLPVFRRFFAVIGDEQSILEDLSSFSASMKRLSEVLAGFDDGSLALLDELGSGTDPEEGGALAAAALETLLSRGGRIVVTTHLSAVKEFAASRPDAQVAAMEFDESSGRPTYRLRSGFLGRSRALATAREQGLPPETLERAGELLGESWRRRERLEAEAEEALARLRQRERDLEAALAQARRESERAAARAEELEERRQRMLREGRESFEKARRELRAAAADAVERVRRERLDAAATQRLVASAEQALASEPVLREAEEEARSQGRRLGQGAAVRLRSGSAAGRIETIEGDRAWVVSGGMRLQIPLSDLVAAPEPRAKGRVAAPEPPPAEAEINVIGRTVEEAAGEVDRAIDRCLSAGAESLRIVHGHGTGRLRAGLRDLLRSHPAVARLRPGGPDEGGNGATVVTLK
jgi:DNA mismatch repair protein MutS2